MADSHPTTHPVHAAARTASATTSHAMWMQPIGSGWNVMGMAQVFPTRTAGSARHQPYVRVEYATRPEYERKGAPGTPDFYRYDHDSHENGSREFWSVSAGARIFLGGGPMRMGSYGALDPTSATMRPGSAGTADHGTHGGR